MDFGSKKNQKIRGEIKLPKHTDRAAYDGHCARVYIEVQWLDTLHSVNFTL